jgi:hypothetical protein
MVNGKYQSEISNPEFLLPTDRVCIEVGTPFGALKLSGSITSHEVGPRSRVKDRGVERYGYAIKGGYIFLDARVDQVEPPVNVECLSLYTDYPGLLRNSDYGPLREAASHGLVIECLAPDVYRRSGISMVKERSTWIPWKKSRRLMLI